MANHLPIAEADLLQRINLGLSAEMWDEYYALIDKRQAETLTIDEQQRLIATSDQLEALNVERIKALAQLAALRQAMVCPEPWRGPLRPSKVLENSG